MAAHDFDNVEFQVSKLSRLLVILEDIAVSRAPCVDAGPETWSDYVDSIAAVVAAMQAFSYEVERLAADYAAKLRASPAPGCSGPADRRYAA
jgi:hypothetical protein